MERRQCGRSGLELPALGLGCWAFGGGEYWGPHEQKDADAVVRRALDLGVTCFDTAEVHWPRPAARHGLEGEEEAMSQAPAETRAVCRDAGHTLPALALEWAVANTDVACTLVGSRSAGNWKRARVPSSNRCPPRSSRA